MSRKSLTILSILLVNVVSGALCVCFCVCLAGVASLCIRWCPLKVAVSVGEAPGVSGPPSTLSQQTTTVRQNFQLEISAEITFHCHFKGDFFCHCCHIMTAYCQTIAS